MMESVTDWLVIFYLSGLLLALAFSIRSYINLLGMKKQLNIDIFKVRPDLLRYLILKTLFWPYFLITEKRLSDRFSALFSHLRR
ncbi:hypothetical protein ACFORL_07205 [Legionella dresdenensis]|uniref:Uncharacterized protein n=1 Tax=Legionella dresdenensis TaxID=450200 RepID=A0ABV8CFJ6_9GAMM